MFQDINAIAIHKADVKLKIVSIVYVLMKCQLNLGITLANNGRMK